MRGVDGVKADRPGNPTYPGINTRVEAVACVGGGDPVPPRVGLSANETLVRYELVPGYRRIKDLCDF